MKINNRLRMDDEVKIVRGVRIIERGVLTMTDYVSWCVKDIVFLRLTHINNHPIVPYTEIPPLRK